MSDKCKEKSARDKISAAARKVFSQKGYHGASVNLIATEAGVNKALLFYYFNSKKNLYQETIQNIFATLRENVTVQKDKFSHIEDRLKETIRLYIDELSKNKDLTSLIIREIAGLGIGMSQDLEELVKNTRQPITDVIQEGVSQGVYRNINPDFVATSIAGILYMFYRHPFDMKMGMKDDEVFDNIIDLINNGTLNKGRITYE